MALCFLSVLGSGVCAQDARRFGFSLQGGADNQTVAFRFSTPVEIHRSEYLLASAEPFNLTAMTVRNHLKGSLNPLLFLLAGSMALILPPEINAVPFYPFMLTNFSLQPFFGSHAFVYFRQTTDLFPEGLLSESGMGFGLRFREAEAYAGGSRVLLDPFGGLSGFSFRAGLIRWM
jgi:hypothetical protein